MIGEAENPGNRMAGPMLFGADKSPPASVKAT
jgi:hypothetical protein